MANDEKYIRQMQLEARRRRFGTKTPDKDFTDKELKAAKKAGKLGKNK